MFSYRCDACGQTFTDPDDCADDSCNRCDEGSIGLNMRPEDDDYAAYCELYGNHEEDMDNGS